MLKLCRSILLSLLAGGIIFLNHALAMQRDPTTMYGGEWPDSYYSESDALKDWSVYNYTSDAWLARKCVVRWGGKTYDPLSFKGNENDTYAVAFHLSTEVAVSAAQSRDGRLFDVAKINGSEAYKDLMAQIQKDLRGDRSSYYARPPYSSSIHPLLNLSLYKAYILRLYRYLTRNHQPHKITNPIPVFKEILTSLRNATEEALGAKMNTTDSFYGENNIYMYVSAPWELNYTYTHAMRHAMKELGMRIHNRYYELEPKPWTAWHNHSNDEKDYCGVNGTLYAFEQARDLVEMMEYDPFYRYGDFRCGTAMVAACFRIEREMKANGTWVEPPRKGVLDFECQSWRECLTAWPWKSELDGEYSRFRLENWEEHPDKNGYAELLRT